MDVFSVDRITAALPSQSALFVSFGGCGHIGFKLASSMSYGADDIMLKAAAPSVSLKSSPV